MEIRSLRVTDPPEHIVDHPIQTHFHTVLRAVDLFHSIGFQFTDFLRRDGPATTDDNTHMLGIIFAQHVHHVAEVLHVAALIGTDRHAIDILLDRRVDDIGHTAVVPEVDNLGAMRLQETANNIDRRVMAIE